MAGPNAAGEPGESATKLVRMQDDCDAETFNAVLGQGACVGDGGTTFEELVESLTEDRDAGAWRFSPDRLTIDRGTGLRALNRGGEVHSFTKVRRFGPGCVPELNELLGFPAGATVAECTSPRWLRTLRAPGESLRLRGLSAGTHRFECLIHPWMRTTVRVRPNRG
ncbi:MAG TPA: hypothetical protein VHG70_04870 [Nocardioidaceae bacterium]|nr:hypothetical protein [Nocardioidaceae bacterium]